MSAPPGSNAWLADHGISPEVWDARPYVRYGPDIEGDPLAPVREEYEGLPQAQQRFASMVANGGRNPYREEHPETTKGGYLIKRYNPPGLDEYLDKVYAEIRPDEAIATKNRQWHYHGKREPKWNPAWTDKWKKAKEEKVPRGGRWGEGLDDWWPVYPKEAGEKLVGRPLPIKAIEGWVRERDADGLRGKKQWQPLKKMADHIERDKDEDDHKGKPTNKVHCHQGIAKYCFVSTPRKPVSVEKTPGKRVTERWKDKTKNIAKRLDMHPMAAKRLVKAKYILFVIEGCIKADSVLTWLIANGWDDWTVVSVPSVTLWQTPGLTDFLDTHRKKRFYIVTDADGFRDDKPNHNVVAQATMLCTKIRKLRIEAAIYSPPFDPDDLKDGKPRLNGVDDFVGEGKRSLRDLVSRGRAEALNTEGWMEAHPNPGINTKQQSRTIVRNAAVIAAMGLHSADGIHYKGTLQSLERISWMRDTTKPPPSEITYVEFQEALNRPPDYLSLGRQRVRDALEDLKAIGAIDYDEEQIAKLKRSPQSGDHDFVEPAKFTILVKELQTNLPDPLTLGQHLKGESEKAAPSEPLTPEDVAQIEEESKLPPTAAASNAALDLMRSELGISD